jgi:hypothetical protein
LCFVQFRWVFYGPATCVTRKLCVFVHFRGDGYLDIYVCAVVGINGLKDITSYL